MDDPILQKQLELFTPEYQTLVMGAIPEMAATTFGDAYRLNEHDKTVLENGIRLYLLAVFSKSEWVDFSSEYTALDSEAAQLFVHEVSTYFSPEIEQTLQDIRGETVIEDSEKLSSTGATGDSLANEIAETEAALRDLPAVRTMESDRKQTTAEAPANEEPVHQSASQDEILQPRAATPKTSIPPAPPTNATENEHQSLQGKPGSGQRWESERSS